MSRDPCAAWAEVLDDQSATEALEWLADRQRAAGIWFGDRPLCTVARPRFLSQASYDALAAMSRDLLGALDRIGRAALEDPALRRDFHLAEWEEQLLACAPRGDTLVPLARIDAFLDPASGTPRLTEFNGETPAGIGYSDALAELFAALPVMQRFRRDWFVRPLPTVNTLTGVLLEQWYRASGQRRLPTIAIVDWAEVPTRSEFELISKRLHDAGIPCRITTPEALSISGDRLCDADGTPIDLVYKRVLLHELVARGGLDHPLLRAALAGQVVMVNPINCKPLHKKASLAVLSDERHAARFTDAEQRAIARHVPWTRVVEERHTRIDGRSIDLVPWIQDHRDQLVLKPNDDYGGAGIVLGWTVDDTAWQQALTTALASPYVVQQRIELPEEPFPALDASGRMTWSQRVVDTAPFGWEGRVMDGILTRISTDALVNVTAGGGSTVPTFVVEPRA